MKIKKSSLQTLFLSFMIGLIIFLTSIFSEFSVEMYKIASQQNNIFTQLGISFTTIFVISFIVWIGFRWFPPLRKAMANIFGMTESLDEQKKETPEKTKSKKEK